MAIMTSSQARENFLAALETLRSSKVRSALTVLGIVIGVTTVIAMVSIIVGFNNSVTRDFQSFGATLVQFQKTDPQFGPGNGDESERQALLLGEPAVFFTARGYEDWPLVLLRLDAVDVTRLEELVTDAWRMRAPDDIAILLQ